MYHNLHYCAGPLQLYNDNMACVLWTKSTTTKGLRHITIWENATTESIREKKQFRLTILVVNSIVVTF